MSNLYQLSIAQAAQGLQKKEFSSLDLTKSCLEQIEKKEEKLHAFNTILKAEALKQAQAIDDDFAAGKKLSPLAGIPGSIKDVIATKGVLTTASSNILKNYVAPYDATCVKRLKQAGLVMVGKNNCDAFAHGASTENSDFGPSRNPWDPTRVPGGSSGGSAAAVAAGMSFYSIGTDTGGSIRQPAAFCGLTSIKPTYGRISRSGLFSMTSSTDCISPLAKSAEDLAYLMQAMAGFDEFDSTTLKVEVPDYVAALQNVDVSRLVIGVPKEYFIEGIDPEVKQRVLEAIEKFRSLGAQIKEVSLPHTKYAIAVYYIITPCEVSSNLARYDGIRFGYSVVKDPAHAAQALNLFDVYSQSRRYGLGAEAKRRIMLGTYALSSGYYDAYYKKASQVRTLIRHDFDRAFKEVDLLLTPTSPKVAFKIGQQADNPLEMYLEDIFVSPASLAGVPAMSVPCGFAKAKEDDTINLPVGFQLIAPQFQEAWLLKTAHAYQQATDWHKMMPK